MMQIQTNSVINTQTLTALADNTARQPVTAQTESQAKVRGNSGNVNAGQSAPLSAEKANPEDVQNAVDKVNEAIQTLGSNGLEFSVDKDTETIVVKVVDQQTNEVIRQIPSEEVLQIAKALDKLQGLLVQDKA